MKRQERVCACGREGDKKEKGRAAAAKRWLWTEREPTGNKCMLE